MKWIKHYDPSELLATIVGIFGGLGTVSFVTYVLGYPLLIASLGASSVLLYGVPNSPLAQPKNLFGGHLIASVVGVTCYYFMGETWYSITITVTIAIILMMLTNTVHPPGGATALISVLHHANYIFILTLMGSISILFISACLASKLCGKRTYPDKSAAEVFGEGQ